MGTHKRTFGWATYSALGALIATAGAALTSDALAATTPNVSFRVNAGKIDPESDYAVKFSVLGTAISYENGTLVPVTVQLHAGNETFEPFGDADSLAGDVNQPDRTLVHHVVPQMFAHSDKVTVTATSWTPEGSRVYERESHDNKTFVKILRDGDALPDIPAFNGQEDIQYFIEPYLTNDNQRILLHPNQALLLFELGTDDPNSAAADFQDVVMLVTFGVSVEDLETNPYGPRRREVTIPTPSLFD